jgi:hypothetical protein
VNWIPIGTSLATPNNMSSPVPTSSPSFHILETEKGWLLKIQNEHCSVVQVFRSASAARLAVDRMMEFFETMSTQAPGSGRAA